jgi:hypothetical protein
VTWSSMMFKLWETNPHLQTHSRRRCFLGVSFSLGAASASRWQASHHAGEENPWRQRSAMIVLFSVRYQSSS